MTIDNKNKKKKLLSVIQRLIIIILFVLNMAGYIYIKTFPAYKKMLDVNIALFYFTLAGFFIFLFIDLFSSIFTKINVLSPGKAINLTLMAFVMLLISAATFYLDGDFVKVIRFMGTGLFFKVNYYYLIFFILLFVSAVFLVWNFHYAVFNPRIYFLLGLGGITLILHILFFMGEASYSPQLPWLFNNNDNFEFIHDCKQIKTNNIDYFIKVHHKKKSYKSERKTYRDRESSYDTNAQIISNINILIVFFTIFIIIAWYYKLRIEYYLAILASLLLLSYTSTNIFYFQDYNITIRNLSYLNDYTDFFTENLFHNSDKIYDGFFIKYLMTLEQHNTYIFTYLTTLIIPNDLFHMLTILLPATVLLRDKTFLKLLLIDIGFYFLLNFLYHILPGIALYVSMTIADTTFILLSFIYLYKYYKTANENPELIEKNRFLKEYLD